MNNNKKVGLIILLTLGLLILGAVGYGIYCLNQIKIEKLEDIVLQDETFDDDSSKLLENNLETEDENLTWEDYGYNISSTDGVVNILLCGEEKIGESKYGGKSRGRTDCMILATMNKKEKSLKLTSIMRDLYVKIPGYNNNKLNASYNIGGMPLLQETIEINFGIKIDGYILIDFDGFKDVIDLLGGVNIELTQDEAKYLNRNNYIAEKKYRNVVAGKNNMNGTQALGYARVRYVTAGNGLRDDYGRNYRQRAVLMQLYERLKNASATDIISLIPKVLKLVTTNISKTQLIQYAADVLTLNAETIETYHLPVEGTYKNARINNMAVLYITDIGALRATFREYVFGDNVDKSKLAETFSIQISENTNTGKTNSSEKNTSTNNKKLTPTPKPTDNPKVEKPKETKVPTKEITQTPEPTETSEPTETPESPGTSGTPKPIDDTDVTDDMNTTAESEISILDSENNDSVSETPVTESITELPINESANDTNQN
jgi:LCP family protein required for cell wall assembly